MKKLISMFLTVMLVTSSMIISTAPVHASTADWEFTGSTCTSSASAASTINYIRAKYDQYSQYKGTGECWGWAEKVSNMLAAERSAKYYSGLKFTKKNFKNKCLGIKAGAHLRLSHGKEYDGMYGHSICLLKVTKKQVCWTDNNYSGYNIIAYHSATLDQFMNYYGQYEYLNALTKTVSYKSQYEPLLAIEKTSDGKSKLFWTKTSGTSKYKVYRATSKNGKYKLIKTTTSKSYKDKSAKYGQKYYYKVRSVKSGYSLDSSKVSSTARLNKPVIIDYGTNDKTGNIWIKWKKVPNADKYKIYRAKSGSSKYEYAATTSKTTYTDKKSTNPAKTYSYKVRAVYSKNTKGNSYKGDPSYWLSPRLAAPKVSYILDESARTLTLTWDKVPYANSYHIGSFENQNYDWYSSVTYIDDPATLSYTIDLNRFYAGNSYEFWVRAIPKSGSSSALSEFVTFEIPEDWTQNNYWEY